MTQTNVVSYKGHKIYQDFDFKCFVHLPHPVTGKTVATLHCKDFEQAMKKIDELETEES